MVSPFNSVTLQLSQGSVSRQSPVSTNCTVRNIQGGRAGWRKRTHCYGEQTLILSGPVPESGDPPRFVDEDGRTNGFQRQMEKRPKSDTSRGPILTSVRTSRRSFVSVPGRDTFVHTTRDSKTGVSQSPWRDFEVSRESARVRFSVTVTVYDSDGKVFGEYIRRVETGPSSQSGSLYVLFSELRNNSFLLWQIESRPKSRSLRFSSPTNHKPGHWFCYTSRTSRKGL